MPSLRGDGGLAGVPWAGPGSQAQDELALVDRAHLVALAGGESSSQTCTRPIVCSGVSARLRPLDDGRPMCLAEQLLDSMSSTLRLVHADTQFG